MKKETEQQMKDAIRELARRIIKLEDEIEYERMIGKLSMQSCIEVEAIQNPDGTLTLYKGDRLSLLDKL